MKISVFGGTTPKTGEPAYDEAYQIGYLLGTHGHVVLTGGYIGVMEAVSKGASEAGGHVIGSTCEEIEKLKGIKANPWVKEEWHFKTLRERMYALIDNCNAAIALPGGIGTLAEISVMWNDSVVSNRISRPLILVGSGWQSIFSTIFTATDGYIRLLDQKRITLVNGIHEAVQIIDKISAEQSDSIKQAG